MRNFKKTLSLVLSVLMVVSCCSVLFATFATAYTTNDTAGSANYGVYTYDFLKEDGASAYGTNGSINHNLMACGGRAGMAVSASNAATIQRRYLVGASEVITSGDSKGMHLVGYSNANVSMNAPNWATRAFVLDPNAGISNSKGFLCLQDNTTYTFILKYKLESLNAAVDSGKKYDPNVSPNALVSPELEETYADPNAYKSTGAYIGIGYLNPKTVHTGSSATNPNDDVVDSKISATSGIAGESSAFGWSELITEVQDEWQYLTITVDADDVELLYPPLAEAGTLSKYVQILVRSKDNEKPVKFHIDSLTVAAIDNDIADYYEVATKTDENGVNSYSFKTKVHTYDFLKEDGTSEYVGAKHNMISCGSDKAAPHSYVNSEGMYLTTYHDASPAGTSFRNRAFVKGSDVALSNEYGVLALKADPKLSYILSLKYKVVDLDADKNGTVEKHVQVGLGYWVPGSKTTTIPADFAIAGMPGTTTSFQGAFTDKITAAQDDWHYLVTTVDMRDMTALSDYTISDYYVQIHANLSSASGTNRATVLIESLSVIEFPTEYLNTHTLVTDNYEGAINNAANLVEKEENNGSIREYNFDMPKFINHYETLAQRQLNVTDYTKYDFSYGSDGRSNIMTSKSEAGIVLKPTDVNQKIAFYTGENLLMNNYYNNAVFAKANTSYYLEMVVSIDGSAKAYTNSTQVRWALAGSLKVDNPKFGWYNTDLTTLKGITEEFNEVVKNKYYDHLTIRAFVDTAECPDAVGKAFVLSTAAGGANCAPIILHSAKILEVSGSAIFEYNDSFKNDDSFDIIDVTEMKGMTMPRPATNGDNVGSHWVDFNGEVFSTIPEKGIHRIYPVYKNHLIDFDSGLGYYDPNSKIGGGWGNSAMVSTVPGDTSNKVLHFYNYMWEGVDSDSDKMVDYYQWKPTNNAVVALTDNPTGETGIKLEAETTYEMTFKYYIRNISQANAADTNISIYQSAENGIGIASNKTHLAPKAINFSMDNQGAWVNATVSFTTKGEDITADQPYLILVIAGGQKALSTNTYESASDKDNAAKAELVNFTDIYFDDFEVYKKVDNNVVNAVADSYTSIREEIAANEQTSALRVSAAISEAAANAASEIGFIALPTKKATDAWYKFDAKGKLANGALSVKVKDVNGLGITGHEDITELLAPTTVPVADGQKAYQVSITGLQTIGKTGAGLRNDAISVVLYTKDAEGNYTYYFANEVSYDQTMTMYAMGGKDIAKYEY